MGAPEITRFLSARAIERNVAASTRNQARCGFPPRHGHLLRCPPVWRHPCPWT